MKTHAPALHLLVLVPHRDARLPLREWSAALFAAGFLGAWSFPHVAPLAATARPLSRDALKTLARALREHIASSAGGGKIAGGLPHASPLPAPYAASVYGPALNLELPPAFFAAAGTETAAYRFSPIVLGAALVQAPPASCPSLPQLSFRAAALATMTCRPLPQENGISPDDIYSLEWKISELCWLPKG